MNRELLKYKLKRDIEKYINNRAKFKIIDIYVDPGFYVLYFYKDNIKYAQAVSGVRHRDIYLMIKSFIRTTSLELQPLKKELEIE